MRILDLLENADLYGYYHKKYPRIGHEIDGLEVLDDVPNTSSISSSLNDFRILDDIRAVPYSDFPNFNPSNFFYNANDFKRSRALAEAIKESGQIKPLIIVVDKKGPYVLEGAHRFLALHYIGISHVPALVVIDDEEVDN